MPLHSAKDARILRYGGILDFSPRPIRNAAYFGGANPPGAAACSRGPAMALSNLIE